MYDSTAAVDGSVRPSLLTDLVMVGKALGSGSPTPSMRTRRLHRRGYCGCQRQSDETTHRMPDHDERIGPVVFGDLQEIADVAVPAVGTGWGDLAAATTTQIHGHDVVARLGQYRHESIELSAIGR